MLAFLIHFAHRLQSEEIQILKMLIMDIAQNTIKMVGFGRVIKVLLTFTLNQSQKLQAKRKRNALIRKKIVKTKLRLTHVKIPSPWQMRRPALLTLTANGPQLLILQEKKRLVQLRLILSQRHKEMVQQRHATKLVLIMNFA